MSSWDQANRGENLGLVSRNRNKISQIINDYLYLPFFLLIILYGLMGRSLIYYDKNLWFAALETWVIVLYYVAFNHVSLPYLLQNRLYLFDTFTYGYTVPEELSVV
jgi:hypothetical protein